MTLLDTVVIICGLSVIPSCYLINAYRFNKQKVRPEEPEFCMAEETS